uniref:Uncharacterized protein n=1 Tax=Panagrolaimus superbus TaxID=310955 RepID=A0A914Y1W2_9BILA
MQTLIYILLFCIYSVFINAQGPYGPMPNMGGYGGQAPLPLPPPLPPMMQGGYGYGGGGGGGNGMEEYGNQQLGAYGNHPIPHGYGPKPFPQGPSQNGMGAYGNPEMQPYGRNFESSQQNYGLNSGGYNKPPQQVGFGDHGIQEGFGFEGFKESNDDESSTASSTLKSSDTSDFTNSHP